MTDTQRDQIDKDGIDRDYRQIEIKQKKVEWKEIKHIMKEINRQRQNRKETNS